MMPDDNSDRYAMRMVIKLVNDLAKIEVLDGELGKCLQDILNVKKTN